MHGHWSSHASRSSGFSDDGSELAQDVIDAGENTVRNVAVAAAVTKVLVAAVVVGGAVGVTYLVTRRKA